MAIIRLRASAATLDSLILRTAACAGDVVDGARPATADQKWSNTAILRALNDMMAEMYVEMGIHNPDAVTLEVDVTYTGGAESIELANNAASSFAINGVLETLNGIPTLLRRVDSLNIDRYRTEGAEPSIETERVWTMRDELLLLRPIPANDVALTLLVTGAPFELTSGSIGGTDQHPFPVGHEELMCNGAANRLQYPNDQLPIGRMMHYNRLWQKWQQTCDLYQGQRFPVDNRRWKG